MKTVFERVRGVVESQLQVDTDEVTMGASFIDDLGVDSLDLVEIVMALEEEFEIEIPEDEAEKLATVGDVVAFVEGKVAV